MNQDTMNNAEINTEADLQKVIKEIETKSETILMNKLKSGQINNSKDLTNIMSRGADEFKEKTGRSMTYSEMRQMFG
jgi:hypothetical protein